MSEFDPDPDPDVDLDVDVDAGLAPREEEEEEEEEMKIDNADGSGALMVVAIPSQNSKNKVPGFESNSIRVGSVRFVSKSCRSLTREGEGEADAQAE